jgi:hypothetical protein
MVELLKSRGLIGDDFKKKEDGKKILRRKRMVKRRGGQ